MCTKYNGNWDTDSCSQTVNDMTMKYLFFRFMDGFFYDTRGGFPYLYNTTLEPGMSYPNSPDEVGDHPKHILVDSCLHKEPVPCLEGFFQNATSQDVLIFTLGFAYCEKESILIDYEAWLRASAKTFRANVLKYFPGKVFHVTNAKTYGFRADVNFEACLRNVDKILWEEWNPKLLKNKEDEQRWFVIDQYSINGDRYDFYNDWLHYLGPLSSATIQQALNHLCPTMGTKVSVLPPIEYFRKVILVKRTLENGTAIQDEYLVDNYGGVRKTHGNCVNVLQHNGTVLVSEEEFLTKVQLFNEDYPDLCHDDTLLRLHNQRNIQVVKNGALHPFSSFRAFASRGYDLENVKVLMSEDYLRAFKPGESF